MLLYSGRLWPYLKALDKAGIVFPGAKQKLFTKVIKMPSKEALVWIDREST
jgi:hypothetical protein